MRKAKKRSGARRAAKGYDFLGLLKSVLNKAIEKLSEYTGIDIPKVK